MINPGPPRPWRTLETVVGRRPRTRPCIHAWTRPASLPNSVYGPPGTRGPKIDHLDCPTFPGPRTVPARPPGGFPLDEIPDRPRNRRRARVRGRRGCIRPLHLALASRQVAGERAYAGDLASRPGGGARLPETPVHDHRDRRGRARDRAPRGTQRARRRRLP